MTSSEDRASSFPFAPLSFAAAAAVAAGLHAFWPVPWLGSPLADILLAIGALGILAGGWLIFSAIRTLSAAGTTVRPDRLSQHLVTAGVYRISRNPIYLGFAVILASLGLLLGVVWLLPAAAAAALVTTRLAILPEERHLAQRFGKRYRDYQKAVRRWL